MEEVAGGRIPAETLRGTGIRFGAVLDEGGGVRPGSDYGIDDKALCTIGLCKKVTSILNFPTQQRAVIPAVRVRISQRP